MNLRSTLYIGVTLAIVALCAAAGPRAQSPKPEAQGRYYKGNLHTHTLNSDGDSTPDEVVTWYREHQYQFLVLTDHNYLTSVDGLNALHGADEKFLVIKGEEVTATAAGKPIHVNALDPERFVPPPQADTVLEMLQGMVDGIRGAKGVPSVNHPNFGWAITADELRQVKNTRLFEVWNGHPTVNNLGGGDVPGLEEVWDRILTSGRMIYGIAVDDAHTFKQPGNPAVPGPGRGWVFVRAARLEARAITDALERGDFYASTGVQLESISVTDESLTIAVRPLPASSKFRIQFVSQHGRVLQGAITSPATYTFRGDEGYIRARVIESNGAMAWTQPVPVGPHPPR